MDKQTKNYLYDRGHSDLVYMAGARQKEIEMREKCLESALDCLKSAIHNLAGVIADAESDLAARTEPSSREPSEVAAWAYWRGKLEMKTHVDKQTLEHYKRAQKGLQKALASRDVALERAEIAGREAADILGGSAARKKSLDGGGPE